MRETFAEQIRNHLRADTSVLVVNTDETVRVTAEIRKAAWSTGNGLKIQMDGAERGEYHAIFAKHSTDFKNYIGPDHIVYNSVWLTKVLETIENKMQVDGAKEDQLLLHQRKIQELLNQVYTTISWDLISGYDNGAECADDLGPALKLLDVNNKEGKEKIPVNCIIVMRDCQSFFDTTTTPSYRELLRNLVEKKLLSTCGESSHHIVFVQPDWTPHRDIQSCVTMLEFSLPNEEQLEEEVAYIESSVDKKCDPELRADLCRTMRGFTQTEAGNALSYCYVKHGGFEPDMLKTIHRLQQATFSKTGVLSMVDDDLIPPMDEIGGFENYMEFIDEAMLCYTPEAAKLKLAKPKGCLLCGIPGSGKSVVARATAGRMKLPLLVYDFGAQFGSLVGQTESTQRQVLKQITAKGPAIVLLDECDKLFSGVVGGFNGDSGTSMRAFGRLLSWMANENESAFVIMTLNRTLGIPPEMLRAGRLDAIFYTTFPTPRERLEVLGIHIKKNGADINCLTDKQWEEIVKITEDYTGAELEMICKKAIRTAFRARRKLDPTFKEVVEAKKIVTPVTKLDRENIDAIEKFCKENAVAVSKVEAESKIFKSTAGRNIKLKPSNN